MRENLRKSGISTIGDVPWGTHICQFYRTKDDLLDILIPYFKAGLENNEFCLWVISEPLEIEGVKEALRRAMPDFNTYLEKGQIEVIPYTDWFTTEGVFDSGKVSNTRVKKLNHALDCGYDGMRLSGNTSWLEKESWDSFIEFKEQTDKNMGNYQLINLCTYPLDKHNAAEIIDVVVNHQFALIKRDGKWKRMESAKRKQAEEAALRATKNWEHTLDILPDPIAILDNEYRILRANRVMAARLGMTPEECVGMACYRVVHGTDEPPSFCPHRQLLKDGLEHTREVREESLGGYFIVSVSPLHDSEGKLTGCIHVARDITKRKQVEEALRESEERLSFALETSHTGAWDLDLVDHTSYRSLEHDRIFGYEQLLPQWTYEMFLDHVLPEDREMVDTKFRKATATRSDWGFECQIRRVDGAVRWILAAGRHHMDSKGSTLRLGGIVQDITERKQAEEALRQSEKRYRMLFDNSMDAIVLTDPRGGGKILSANQAACGMLGWSKEELIGKGRDVMFDLQDPALSALLDECALSGSARAHITYRRKDGTNFPGEVSTASFTDSNGEPRIVAIIRDITERKKAEEALHESEKRERARSDELAAVLDAVPVSVYITHDPQALKITGNRLSYEWQQIPVGTNFSKSSPEGVRPEMFKLLRDGVEIPPAEMPSQMAAAGIEVNDCELDIVSADGKIRHVFGNARPLRDEQGNLRGSISAFIDITKRKEAETKLKETLDNLEYLVKERTAELEQTYISLKESEKGLADAQKMAHIGNWDWNIATNEIYCSDELYLILGCNPPEISVTYDAFLSYVHPDDRNYVNNAAIEALNGKPGSIDHRIILANGEERTVYARSEAIFDEEKNPIRMKGILQDITERKKAEEMLKESESKLKALFELLPIGVSITDKERNILDANLALENILDLTRSDLLKGTQKTRKYLRPNGTEMPVEEFPNVRALKEKGSIQSSETGIIKEDGSTIWTDVNAISLPFPDGQVVITTRDITGSKKAKEELQKTEERYRIVTEQTGQLVYDYDVEKDAADWAGNIKELTGFTPDEFRSMSLQFWLSRIYPEDLNRYLENYDKFLRSGGNYRSEYRFRKQNEEYIYFEDNGICLRDRKGNTNRILGVVKDITERKQAEKTLANIEIARKQEIHHRIKNNLQVISSLLDLQSEKFRDRECVEDSEVLKAFRESQDRVMSIALIHEELHEGRGNDTLNISLYIKRLVKNLFQTYRLGNSDTRLNIDLEEDIFFDMDTAVPLGIIINELVSNSLKYAFPGKDRGLIKIKLCKEESGECTNNILENEKVGCGDNNFILTVLDNGVGIPEGFNSESSASLGLQLVSILVDQLGGKLELKRDSGTEFIIRFTVAEKNKN